MEPVLRYMGIIPGVQIFADKYAPEFEYVRSPILPASKSKRIRRKWEKRYPQTRRVRAGIYQTGFGMIGHPNNIDLYFEALFAARRTMQTS